MKTAATSRGFFMCEFMRESRAGSARAGQEAREQDGRSHETPGVPGVQSRANGLQFNLSAQFHHAIGGNLEEVGGGASVTRHGHE